MSAGAHSALPSNSPTTSSEDAPRAPRAAPSPWRRGDVDGLTHGGDTHLVHASGASLWVRAGRLRAAHGYADAPRPVRQELARVGAMIRLRALGRFHVHAAAVIAPDGGTWLLAGESGSGKSTLAYALGRQGWPVLGDDGVVLERAGDELVVHGWREVMRVSIELARWFPELDARRDEVDWEDARHRVPVTARFVRRGRAAGLLVVERGTSDTIAPLPPTAALAALIPQSAMVLLHDGHDASHLDTLRALVERVPAFRFTHTEAQLHRMARTIIEAGS